MTTREELHRLVEELPDGALDAAAVMLRQYAPDSDEPPYPRSVGILAEAPADLSQRTDDHLAEGFPE